MVLVKVDIKTGRVVVNNLEEHWKGLLLQGGPDHPGCRETSTLAGEVPVNEKLMQKIKKFNRRRKNKRWTDEELYQLLVLSRQKSHAQVADRLRKTRGACRQMLHLMKKAGLKL
ncbi:MAG: hypothetical protein H0Z40_09525 [Desulfotomaculum sp.]|nr:hypothetical protein [Desulfotomaculum sp.]